MASAGPHVREEELGLSVARRRGIREARGEIVVFVDDDNVLAPDYLDHARSIMQDASIGALGGVGTPLFEDGASPPAHFYDFTAWLACGAQLGLPENVAKDLIDLTALHHVSLFGAGLVVRHTDMRELNRLPHFPILSGRRGDILSSGEDYEMCYLIALKGKRLVSSPRAEIWAHHAEQAMGP